MAIKSRWNIASANVYVSELLLSSNSTAWALRVILLKKNAVFNKFPAWRTTLKLRRTQILETSWPRSWIWTTDSTVGFANLEFSMGNTFERRTSSSQIFVKKAPFFNKFLLKTAPFFNKILLKKRRFLAKFC